MLELLLSEEKARLAALVEISAEKLDVRPMEFGAVVLLQT
jgi:hypothetical protein